MSLSLRHRSAAARLLRLCVPIPPGLIDLHWVRALTVPMHLGLIDGPSVPHNLISAQESPASLPTFRWTPDLKLNVLWVQQTNLFSQKFRQANLLHVAQWGPYGGRCPYPEPFLTYLPGSPVKEPSPEKRSTPRDSNCNVRQLMFFPLL